MGVKSITRRGGASLDLLVYLVRLFNKLVHDAGNFPSRNESSEHSSLFLVGFRQEECSGAATIFDRGQVFTSAKTLRYALGVLLSGKIQIPPSTSPRLVYKVSDLACAISTPLPFFLFFLSEPKGTAPFQTLQSLTEHPVQPERRRTSSYRIFVVRAASISHLPCIAATLAKAAMAARVSRGRGGTMLD